MAKVNSIAFDKSKFKDEADFWKTVADQMRILVDNQYDVAFRYEDCNIYVIEFSYSEHLHYGTPVIRWVEEEY